MRLLDRIRAIVAADCRVALVHAPAGYGKTTLLGQLQRCFIDQGHFVAWLTCSTEDKEPETFRESCRRSLLESLPPESRRHLAGIEVTDLAGFEMPLCLILDDFQHAASLENWNLVASLGAVLPGNVTILVGSRAKPPPEVARFVIDGTLAVVDSQLLKFDPQEIAEIMAQAGLPNAALQSLIRLSEGWPAIVKLASLNAHLYIERPDVLPAGSHLGSTELFDYLTSEIFGELSPAQRALLEDCSILPYLDLHATGNGEDAEQPIPGWLAGLHPLISIVDEDPPRIHFHPLLSDYLTRRIRKRDPKVLTALHRRAAAHFLDKGAVYEAIQCAVRGGDWTLAAEYFERIGGVLAIVDRGPPKVKALLELFPQSLVMETPTLLMAATVLAVAENSCLEARQCYLRLAELCDVQGEQDVSGAPMLFRLTLFYYAIIGDLFEDLRHVVELLEPTLVEIRTSYNHDKRFLCLALSAQFLLLQRYGDTGPAERALMEFIEICQVRGYAGRLPSRTPHLGLLSFARGNYELALSYVEGRQSGFAFEFSRREVSMEAVVNAMRARIHFDRNQQAEALACLDALDAMGDVAFPEIMTGVTVTRARVLLAQGHGVRALELLEFADSKARQYKLIEWRNIIAVVKAEILCRTGQTDQAWRAAADGGLIDRWPRHSAAVRPWPLLEADLRAMTALLINKGELSTARTMLLEVQLRAAQAGREQISATALILLAVIEHAAGRKDRCRRYIEQALARTAISAVTRPYIELGGEAMTVIGSIAENGTAQVAQHARQILQEYESSLAHPFAARDDLTSREIDTAIGLASGYSNKRLAKRLGVTPETLKGYVKIVFRKLDASTRAEVAQKVRALAALL